MRFGSLFAGIGGFDLGFERAGMECAWQVENDPYPNTILKKHWPDVPRLEDVCYVGQQNLEPVELICGGFPCQDISRGNREQRGLEGDRSGLWFEFHRIIAELRPRWAIIENVPSLLTSNGGRDFLTILRGLDDIGYACSWRVLDAQYFGSAAKRERVFIVASPFDKRFAGILLDGESGAWDFAPERTEEHDGPAPADSRYRSFWDGGQLADTLDASQLFKGQMMPEKRRFPVVLEIDAITDERYLRRFTEVEVERMMGFPDNWTEGISRTRRMKALGNAVCVPVVEWIGHRIVHSAEDENG